MSEAIVQPGDYVRDNGRTREVHYLRENDGIQEVYMTDGGVMGLDEISHDDVLTESEVFG